MATYYQEMNGQVEVTWQTLQTTTHSIMVHTRVSDKYINFELIYMTDHILPVLKIKHLANQECETTMPHKLATGTKHSVSNIYVLFYPCVVRNSAVDVETKALNMHHQSQKCFRGTFIGIPQHHKG